MIEIYKDKNKIYTPNIDASAWVHNSSVVIGRVTLSENVSVWPCAVIRGDVNDISIGKNSNIQDGAIVHATHPSPFNPDGFATNVGEDVTIGHNVILHGCSVRDRVLVGMGTTILDGSIINSDVIIGANSFVPMNKVLESGFLYLGSPVKAVRKLTDKELSFLKYSANNYAQLKNQYIK